MGSLGARIRQSRREIGVTLEVLAKRAGLAKGFLSQLENGHSQPTALPLLNISKALGVTADYLLTGVQ